MCLTWVSQEFWQWRVLREGEVQCSQLTAKTNRATGRRDSGVPWAAVKEWMQCHLISLALVGQQPASCSYFLRSPEPLEHCKKQFWKDLQARQRSTQPIASWHGGWVIAGAGYMKGQWQQRLTMGMDTRFFINVEVADDDSIIILTLGLFLNNLLLNSLALLIWWWLPRNFDSWTVIWQQVLYRCPPWPCPVDLLQIVADPEIQTLEICSLIQDSALLGKG